MNRGHDFQSNWLDRETKRIDALHGEQRLAAYWEVIEKLAEQKDIDVKPRRTTTDGKTDPAERQRWDDRAGGCRWVLL